MILDIVSRYENMELVTVNTMMKKNKTFSFLKIFFTNL